MILLAIVFCYPNNLILQFLILDNNQTNSISERIVCDTQTKHLIRKGDNRKMNHILLFCRNVKLQRVRTG